MKKVRVILFMIGPFFVLLSTPAYGASCDAVDLQQTLNSIASIAKSLVDPADESIVLNAVAAYPEGSSPPTFATQYGQLQVQIPSKAAASFSVWSGCYLPG